MTEPVTVAVINYNGIDIVCRTLESVLAMQSVEIHVLVIDDGSDDGSREAIEEQFPDIPVHTEPQNTGRLNRLRNKALALAETNRVLITDNDIIFDSQCLKNLMAQMDADDLVATCTPRLMYLGDPDRVFASGGIVHYLGVSVDEGRGRLLANDKESLRSNASGGIMLIDKSRLGGVSGFDEDYRMGWGDDGEFYHELLLAGKKCFYVSRAFALHEDKPFSDLRSYRARGQLYNRWRFILTNYALSTLLSIIPVLLLFELMQIGFFVVRGMTVIYIQGSGMAIRDLAKFYRRRKCIQLQRRISDRDLLNSGPIYIGSAVIRGSKLIRFGALVASGIFTSYWTIIRTMLPRSKYKID